MGLSSMRFVCCRKHSKTKTYRMFHGARRAFPHCFCWNQCVLCRLTDVKPVKAASSTKDLNVSEEVSGVFELWTGLTAFFTTVAYTSIDQKDSFGFGKCNSLWTKFSIGFTFDNGKSREGKGWRGDPGTSDLALLHFNAPKIALVFHASIPSGVLRIVNVRRQLRQLMVRPGWGPAQALPVNGIYDGPICLPIPINTVYVGFGNQKNFLRPSPWCNPFVFFTEDKQEANWILAQFGRSRADKVHWLSPIFGKQLACDCGQSKCHAVVLDELICEMETSGAMTNEGSEFSAALSGRNSIPDGTGAPSCMLPPHLRFALKHRQPGRNLGQCFALKCGERRRERREGREGRKERRKGRMERRKG